MPAFYPGEDRISSLETLLPTENELVHLYEKLIPKITDKDISQQLNRHLSLKREHLFTQEWLLKNAQKIKGLTPKSTRHEEHTAESTSSPNPARGEGRQCGDPPGLTHL